MIYQSLNGIWDYTVGGKTEKVIVPFSKLPVGRSVCETNFDITEKNKYIFLEFLGITYHAQVYLNGEYLGEMLPYCEYEFDITQKVLLKDNNLKVVLEDIAPHFGPTEGWENFGGIIRDVGIKYYKGEYIEDVFFYTSLTNNYRDAEYTVEIKTSVPEPWSVKLLKQGEVVDFHTHTADETKAVSKVQDISLWSTDTPNLYTLEVQIGQGDTADTYVSNVGFREIKCDKHAFIINGKPTFIHGVCKHEMFGDSGHTPTPEQIEQDFRMIKDTGCNFMRLVHYPHNKVALDIADKIGIMVSEEPGLWWSDTSDPEVARGSLEVLRRTVIRDRNRPCVAFWLCFNECKFTEKFLIDAANTCKVTDPTRLVSGANCMNFEDTVKYYNICNFDFYTMHPYSPNFDLLMRSAQILNDKPLIFTEWGGYFVYDNPHLLTDFIRGIKKLFVGRNDEAALAGACFWEWSEVNDFNRSRPACVDGVLKEGLVDVDRNPNIIYNAYKEAWAERELCDEDLFEFSSSSIVDGILLPFEGGIDYKTLVEIMHKPMPQNYVLMRGRKLKVGPRLQDNGDCGLLKTPLTASVQSPIRFNGAVKTGKLTIIGAVSAPWGYPVGGRYGETAALLKVRFDDGDEKIYQLKNGVDITCAMTTLGSSRINPISENAVPFARFSYNKNHENYLINLLDVNLEKVGTVVFAELVTLNENYNILIYGIYA